MRIDIPASRPAGGFPKAMGKLPGRRLGLLFAALLVSISAGYIGYQRYLAAAQPTTAVQTMPARVGSLVSSVTATGNVIATRQAKVGFSASGKLSEVSVNVGDSVKTGQQLAKLDIQALQIKMDQADANLKTAQIKLQQLKDGATPEDIAAARAAYDAAMAKYNDVVAGATDADRQSAQSAVDQAQASLASAQAKFDQTKAGATQADLVSAKTAVDQAQAQLVSTQAKLDAAKNPYTQGDWASAMASVDSAKSDLTSAKAKLDQVKSGSLPSDLATQQAAVSQANTNLMAAQDRLEAWKNGDTKGSGGTSNSQIEQSVETAKAEYDAAVAKLKQMSAGPLPADLQAAITSVDKAQASYNSAIAKLDDMKKGPLATDVAQAQSAVDTAKANLASSQAKYDQLNAGPQQADVVSAQSAVDNANAQLAAAKAKLDDLNKGPKAADVQAARSGLVSAQAQVAAKANPPKDTDIALAEQQIRLAQAGLDQAKLDLANGVLAAPFDGVVATVSANPGEQVGATPIITLVDPKQVRIDVTVDESDVAKLSLGQPATISFDAIAGTRLNGKVIALSPSGTSTQGVVSYLVSVSVDNPPKMLPSGMSASVSIETQRKDNVLLVPLRAVRTQGQSRTVQVMPAEKDAKPVTRQVQTGAQNDQLVEIVSGLNADDQVVIPTTSTSQSNARMGGPGGGFGGPGGFGR